MRLLLFFLILTNAQLVFSQDLLWAKVLNNPSLSETLDEDTKDIALDASGNIYITGNFQGTLDFDPGPGIQNLTSAGVFNTYFAKYDASGNYVFAKTIAGAGENDIGYSIALDNSGNIYLTGSFENTADFDPGPGIQNLTSNGVNDIFIAKYDNAGNYIYAKSFGGTGPDHAYSLALDASSNIYVAGTFWATVDFDPGVAVQNVTSVGGSDIFYARYDASGNYVYAKGIGGIANDVGLSIAVNASVNVFITGFFSVTADFDPDAGIHTLTAIGPGDIFLAKYDASGNYVFANAMNGTITSNNWANSIVLDGSGNIYLTGGFTGITDFDPGIGTQNLTSMAGHDTYFAKYDASGNYVYAKNLNGSGFNESGECISLDAAGNIYITGYFDGTVDFDPNGGVQSHISAGFYDIFLAKYDNAGNYIYSKTMGNTGADIGLSTITDESGNTYLIGVITGVVDFDPAIQLIASNSTDIFIAKFGPSSPLPVTLLSFNGRNDGSINKLSWATSTEINNKGFELQRSYDGVNFNKIAFIPSKAGNGNSTSQLDYTFTDINPLPGSNYYRLKQIDIDGRFLHSRILVIRTTKSNTITIKNIYPNPVVENLNIDIYSPASEKVSIIINNMDGKMIMRTETKIIRGDNLVSLPVKFLTKGSYSIKLIVGEKSEKHSYKFIKL